MTLICRQVDWTHNKSSSIEERLGEVIDIEAELIKYKKNAWKGVYKCPYCGETPSSVILVTKNFVRCCFDFRNEMCYTLSYEKSVLCSVFKAID